MLGRGKGAVLFDAAHECRHKLGNALRVFAEGPNINDGIVGIAVDIGNRSKNPVNARRARFQRGDAPHRVGVLRIFADRKSTRLNSSHGSISYAVFCLKKKKRSTELIEG